jgi:hypothetical protein
MMRLRLSTWIAVPVLMTGLLGLGQGAAAQDVRPANVIELFTSQGCSSCPTADALLQQYAKRPDIVALSLPVDYWDYLGWKDTLASPRFTGRQRGYAEKRGDGNVYTPQVVVNGLAHAVGSNKDEIDRALDKTAIKLRQVRVAVSARSDGKTIAIEMMPSISQQDSGAGGTIWVATVQPTVDVEVQRGENRGKKITYTNVVRDLTAVGNWSGQPERIELSEASVLKNGKQRCAVLLQEGKVGAIVGAAWMIGPTN